MSNYVGYKDMPYYICNRLPFKGNSVTAIRHTDNSYVIYSYDTVIYNSKDNYFNNRKYSHTTSRLQNIIKREVINDLYT